jgi:hypothetical protein
MKFPKSRHPSILAPLLHRRPNHDGLSDLEGRLRCAAASARQRTVQLLHQRRVAFKIGGEEIILRAGELVEIPSNVPHEAVMIEDFTGIDVVSPIRRDWRDGTDNYLRQANQAK